MLQINAAVSNLLLWIDANNVASQIDRLEKLERRNLQAKARRALKRRDRLANRIAAELAEAEVEALRCRANAAHAAKIAEEQLQARNVLAQVMGSYTKFDDSRISKQDDVAAAIFPEFGGDIIAYRDALMSLAERFPSTEWFRCNNGFMNKARYFSLRRSWGWTESSIGL